MTGLERVLNTLAGKPTAGGIAVALHNFLMAAKMLGLPSNKCLFDGELLAKAQIHSWQTFGHDMLMVENGVCATAQALGCEIACSDDQPPHVLKPLITRPEEIEDMQIPDPENTFPLCEMLKAIRLIKNRVKKHAFVIGRADQGPMALAAAIYGPQQLVMDIASGENESQIHKLIEFCTRCTMRYADSLGAAGSDGTCIGGYGLSMISPSIFREFELPYEKMFVEHCHENNLLIGVHICGHEDPILEDMVSTGADWLELDPMSTPHIVAQVTKNRCAVLGMINPVSLLQGTVQRIQSECLERIKQMAECRFILGPGCALPPFCPEENIHAMIKVARNACPVQPSHQPYARYS